MVKLLIQISYKLYGVLNILICPGILIENLMTSQKLTKGLNEPMNMLITFMVSIWKVTGFQGVGKTFLSNELWQYFGKIKRYKQNNYTFSLSDSSKNWKFLGFQ